MSFDDKWEYPSDHPLSEDKARALAAGDLGRQYFDILARTCSPLYWHGPDNHGGRSIRTNGTLTYIQSSEGIFGVTAAHVIRQYQEERDRDSCVLQLGNAGMSLELIDIDERLDLATLVVPETVRAAVGKELAPVSLPRIGDLPQEGRGIMLAGFPGADREEFPGLNVGWGMFGAVGISRRVNDKQITWSPDHEHHIPVHGIPPLSPNKELGGISGGPLIAWFEKAGGWLVYYSLAGVVVEANSGLENVAAMRSEFIRPNGKLRRMG